MKNLFKTFVIAAAGLLVIASCAKWTETESIKITQETIQSKNPELYQKYLESLREYRGSEHQVMIVKFDNAPLTPASRAEHLTFIPDSVDFVVLTAPGSVSETHVAEIKEIREQKGIKTLALVDLAEAIRAYNRLINEEYEAYKELEEPTESDIPVDTPERLAEFVRGQLKGTLDAVTSSGLDGIHVTYVGVNPVSYTEEQLAVATERQQAALQSLNEWMSANQDAIVFYEGTPGHIICDTPLIDRAKYVIIPAVAISNPSGLSYTVQMAMTVGENSPADRIVIGVSAINPYDPAITEGRFIGGVTAIVGAAQWCETADPDFTKCGVCVAHSQYDAYSSSCVYSQINQAVSIMNPSISK